MTVTTTTTTTTPTPKSRFRVRTEPMPAHFFTAPEGAPACYGDPAARCLDCVSVRCAFRNQCADFIARAHLAERSGGPVGTACPRIVVPEDAPLILDEARFRAAALDPTARPRTALEQKLWQYADPDCHEGAVGEVARLAYVGGLIPVQAAIEATEWGANFLIWLSQSKPPERGRLESRLPALIWTTGEITRQALHWQGRPHAFAPRHHHQLWRTLAGREKALTRGALAERLKRIERSFADFREWTREVFEVLDLPAPWEREQDEAHGKSAPRRAA